MHDLKVPQRNERERNHLADSYTCYDAWSTVSTVNEK